MEMKEKLDSKLPSTSITFVMMKRNIHDLPLMVKITKDLKVDILNVKNFDVLTNKKDIEQIVFCHDSYNKLDDDFIKFRDNNIADTITIANRLNVILVIYPLVPNKSNRCKLASTSIFISHKGEISLCCATGHPVPRMLDRTNILDNAKINYGNLNTDKLSNILQSKEYLKCRDKAIQDIVPIECEGCLLSEGL